MPHLVVNVGCIECGVSSGIVGLFSSKERADEIADGLYKTHDWRQGGQNNYEVFLLPVIDIINPDYISNKTDGPNGTA